MFEKESKEYAIGLTYPKFQDDQIANIVLRDVEGAFQKGAESGYNKANEWHDLRENPNDLPKDTTSLYLVRVYSWDFGLSHLYKKYGMYIPTVCEWSGEYFKALDNMGYSNARNIKCCIAWKEIVLPELKESE